jgi:hypothetical protein
LSDQIKHHFVIPDSNIRQEKIEPHGGGKTFRRTDFLNHGTRLVETTAAIISSVAKKEDYQLSGSLYLNLVSPEDVPIKSERLKLKNLGFEVLKLYNDADNKCLAKITKVNFSKFQEKVYKYAYENTHPGKSNFAVLENVEEISISEKLSEEVTSDGEGIQDVIIYLYNTISPRERFGILNRLEQEISAYDEQLQSQIFYTGSIAVACQLRLQTINYLLDNYITIKSIVLNSIYSIPQSVAIGNLAPGTVIAPPISQSLVAVIDSGVNSTAGVFKDLVTTSLRYLPALAVGIDYSHGSFVASRCSYGDLIEECLNTKLLTPYCKIMDVTVFGVDALGKFIGPSDFHLRNSIEEVVKKYHKQVKVYNLSLGKQQPIRNFSFSELARTIDTLSKDFDVIFVVSAGNIAALLGSYPSEHFSHLNSRVGSPAESLLAITVGAIAKYEETGSLALIDEISPFSRIGPGADGGLKPELVCHGGNYKAPYNFSHRIATTGLHHNGLNLAIDCGTSFSAPLVSQFAVRLIDAFPDASSNLIKALLYHFAQKRRTPKALVSSNAYYTGFGEPQIDDAIYSSTNNLSYIYEGFLDSKEYLFVAFSIPKVFKSISNSKLKVKITIVFNPSVDPINDLEYSLARMSASLFKSSIGGFKEIHIDTNDKYSLAWNPIIQFEKEFTRGYLTGDWELRLRLFVRGKLTKQYKQPFATVIEIIDSKGKIDVFEEGKNELSTRYEDLTAKTAAA